MKIRIKTSVKNPSSGAIWEVDIETTANDVINTMLDFEQHVLDNHYNFITQSVPSPNTEQTKNKPNNTNQSDTGQVDILDPKEEEPNSGHWAVYQVSAVQISMTRNEKGKQLGIFIAPPPTLEFAITRLPIPNQTIRIPQYLIDKAFSREFQKIEVQELYFIVIVIGKKVTKDNRPYLNGVFFSQSKEECVLYGRAYIDNNQDALMLFKEQQTQQQAPSPQQVQQQVPSPPQFDDDVPF